MRAKNFELKQSFSSSGKYFGFVGYFTYKLLSVISALSFEIRTLFKDSMRALIFVLLFLMKTSDKIFKYCVKKHGSVILGGKKEKIISQLIFFAQW